MSKSVSLKDAKLSMAERVAAAKLKRANAAAAGTSAVITKPPTSPVVEGANVSSPGDVPAVGAGEQPVLVIDSPASPVSPPISSRGIFLVPLASGTSSVGSGDPSSNRTAVVRYVISVIGCPHPKKAYQAATRDAPALDGVTTISADEYGTTFPLVCPSNLSFCSECVGSVTGVMERSEPRGALCPYFTLADFKKEYPNSGIPDSVSDDIRSRLIGNNLFINLSHPDFAGDVSTLSSHIIEVANRRNFSVGWVLNGTKQHISGHLARSFAVSENDMTFAPHPYSMGDAELTAFKSPAFVNSIAASVEDEDDDFDSAAISDSVSKILETAPASSTPITVGVDASRGDLQIISTPAQSTGVVQPVSRAEVEVQTASCDFNSTVETQTDVVGFYSSSSTQTLNDVPSLPSDPISETSFSDRSLLLSDNLDFLRSQLGKMDPINFSLTLLLNSLSSHDEIAFAFNPDMVGVSKFLFDSELYRSFCQMVHREHVRPIFALAFCCSNLVHTHSIRKDGGVYYISRR